MTREEREKITDEIDSINEQLDDIRFEYQKANDDEEYASANDLDCSPFVNYKYELGHKREALRMRRDALRARLSGA